KNWEALPGIFTQQIVLLNKYSGKQLKVVVTELKKGKTAIKEAISKDPVVDKGNPHTDWFKNAGVGVMLHYLKDIYAKEGGSEAWNAAVDKFDTELFAEDCKKAGASYVMFALGQNSGYYCAPNAAYDRITGAKPGTFCSHRDLPADLLVSLKKRGIKLLFYLPGNPPISNKLIADRFAYTYGKDSPTSQFTQAAWEAVIREWSLRYGKDLMGWWFDGMYRGGIIETRSDMSLAHNISTHTLAAKAGNPAALVSYNYGVAAIQSNSPYDDYSAGEKQYLDETPQLRWVQPGIQWFFFTYLGNWWAAKGTRFSTDALTKWAEKVLEKEGVICFDIFADERGKMDANQMEQIKAVRTILSQMRQ
ncbi:alpha-L-fucosidase, partial [Flavihumibacter sp. CACIAM 22H1]|uniref:alpha-L-fucosidase n=1 Tax=Flavihumibacter sp. CACIAM 22H1 TaxID=1812911 RepID=UPI0025BA593A